MRTFPVSLGASILALFLISCGSSSSDAPGGDGGALNDATTASGSTPLPCDVSAVLQANCQSCHQNPPINGAPMSLITWEDTQAPLLADPDGVPPTSSSEKVFSMIETRVASTSNPMPPAGHKALDAVDLATLASWVNAGGPAGTAGQVCTGDAGGVPDANAPALSCTTDDTSIVPASDFAWPDDAGAALTDEYVCYSFTAADIPAGVTRHILGITPNIDNHDIVHHVLFFQADPGDTSGVTTTPTPCNAGGSLQWRIVYGWAPGGGAMQTPPGVGFPYDSTTEFVVQIHYNNIHGYKNQTDHTGFSMCTTDQPVANDADVIAFGSMNFDIPAHGALDTTCNWTVPSLLANVHTFAAFPHMHQIGTAIQTEQLENGGGGGIVDMGQNTPWNFNTQIWFPIEATLKQGDVVSTRCAWTNSTDQDVKFGQYTEDEMCYSFTAYYPKVNSSLWSWALPAAESTCATTAAAGLPIPDAGWVVPEDSGLTFTPEDGGGVIWGGDAGTDAADAN
jgi:hypothetical protein